jgi:redox-regulated HSP33 family molecular chaperone
MADMSITEDQLRSRVEGVIYGARVVSITPIGEETYETKLALSQATINELVSNYLQSSDAGR